MEVKTMKISISLAVAATVVGLLALGCEEAVEKGSIAGNVKDDGANVSGAFCLLLEEGKMVTGETPLSNASVTNGQGNYTIYLVEPNKNFYLAAIKDNDNNQQYTPGTDAIGYYGTYNEQTHVWIPTVIRLGSGEDKTGVNVADMYVMPAD